MEGIKKKDTTPKDFYFEPTSEMSEVRMIDEFDYVLGAKNGDGNGAINHSLQSLVNRDKYLENRVNSIEEEVNKGNTGQSLWKVVDNSAIVPKDIDEFTVEDTSVNSNIDFVVGSYHDDNGNWYRVYKSGWCEQGGIATLESSGTQWISLQIPILQNKPYYSNVIFKGWVNGNFTNTVDFRSENTTTWETLYVVSNKTNFPFFYEVKGYYK